MKTGWPIHDLILTIKPSEGELLIYEIILCGFITMGDPYHIHSTLFSIDWNIQKCVVEFCLAWPFRRDEEDSQTPMTYVEIVYKTWSWRNKIMAHLPAQWGHVNPHDSLQCSDYICSSGSIPPIDGYLFNNKDGTSYCRISQLWPSEEWKENG